MKVRERQRRQFVEEQLKRTLVSTVSAHRVTKEMHVCAETQSHLIDALTECCCRCGRRVMEIDDEK